jgi:hypothetical protein
MLAAKLGKNDIGAVHLHDLSNLVQATKKYIVQLGIGDGNVFDKRLGPNNEIAQSQLSIRDLIGQLARNDDFVFWSTSSPCWAVSINLWKWRREVDGGVRRGLYVSDVLARSPTDKGVHRQVNLHSINVKMTLKGMSVQHGPLEHIAHTS